MNDRNMPQFSDYWDAVVGQRDHWRSTTHIKWPHIEWRAPSLEDAAVYYLNSGETSVSTWLYQLERMAWDAGGLGGDMPAEWGDHHARALAAIAAVVKTRNRTWTILENGSEIGSIDAVDADDAKLEIVHLVRSSRAEKYDMSPRSVTIGYVCHATGEHGSVEVQLDIEDVPSFSCDRDGGYVTDEPRDALCARNLARRLTYEGYDANVTDDAKGDCWVWLLEEDAYKADSAGHISI